MPEYRAGQIVPLRYKSREIQVIIIDPNGLGPDKPSIGLGLRGMDRHIGIPRQTLSDRVSEIEGVKYLKLPSGDTFRVSKINAEDGKISTLRLQPFSYASTEVVHQPGGRIARQAMLPRKLSYT